MTQESNSKLVLIQPLDVSLKTTDIVEKIISGIMETGEVNVVGVSDSIFLACSAISMASEIAKIYVNDICIANLEAPTLAKTPIISAVLGQNQIWDYAQSAEQEDKELKDAAEQTVSVSRAATMERLLTISLLRLAKYDEVKIVAAGGSINDAVVLALKLTSGQLSKEPVGIKLFHLYSILMRNDPSKSIAAVSIYLQKGMSTRYTKRQSDLFKKLESGGGSKKE